MSTEKIEDKGGVDEKVTTNPETPLTQEWVEASQKNAEKDILKTATKIKWELWEILWNEEILKNHKWAVIGNIANYVTQVDAILAAWWSEEYVKELWAFKSFLEEEREKLLSTLTPEEKAELDKPKSTWTWAANNDAYKANRYYWKAWKKWGRMF